MGREYDDSEEDLLVALNVSASCFSFIGASFIIANYCFFPGLRTFAFKLILFVAIGDIINSIGNFMGSPDGNNQKALCTIQGLLTQFGDLTSFGWVTAIAWTIYTVLTSQKSITKADAARWFRRMHYFIWTTTIVLSILPITTYGPSGGLCWIDDSSLGEVWRWLCFYLPLWTAIGFMIWVYVKVWNQIKPNAAPTQGVSTGNVKPPSPNAQGSGANVAIEKQDSDYAVSTDNVLAGGGSTEEVIQQGSSESNEANKSAAGRTLQRIKYYPVILFCCYFFATVRRLYELIADESAPIELACLQVFFSALLGTCNAIIYGGTPAVREKDREFVRNLCGNNGDDIQKQHLTDNDPYVDDDSMRAANNAGDDDIR